MTFFVASLCVGLGGLLLMAVPGVRRHGRAGHARAARGRGGARGAARGHVVHAARGHAVHPVHGHAGHAAHGHAAPAQAAGHGHAHQVPHAQRGEPVSAVDGILHYVPEPRVVLTVIALFGAFGNVLAHVTHFSYLLQVAGAAALAVLVEWLIVGRIWRLALQFTGEPSSPMEMLLMQRVHAVTAFHNGKGIIQAERDGRAMQLSAELIPDQRDKRVEVGDSVMIEEVDPEHERVLVSTE